VYLRASLNLCITVCIECSGMHRQLGTHLSKVRSLTLDIWSDNTVALLTSIGNDRANSVWEDRLSVTKPTQFSSREERQNFITQKYLHKQFLKPRPSEMDVRVALLTASTKGNLFRLYSLLVNCPDAATTINSCVSNADGKSALHYAVEGFMQDDSSISKCTFKQIIELLCLWGANSQDLTDGTGQSAYVLAAELAGDDLTIIMNQYT
jgi:hypothetical protein